MQAPGAHQGHILDALLRGGEPQGNIGTQGYTFPLLEGLGQQDQFVRHQMRDGGLDLISPAGRIMLLQALGSRRP